MSGEHNRRGASDLCTESAGEIRRVPLPSYVLPPPAPLSYFAMPLSGQIGLTAVYATVGHARLVDVCPAGAVGPSGRRSTRMTHGPVCRGVLGIRCEARHPLAGHSDAR